MYKSRLLILLTTMQLCAGNESPENKEPVAPWSLSDALPLLIPTVVLATSILSCIKQCRKTRASSSQRPLNTPSEQQNARTISFKNIADSLEAHNKETLATSRATIKKDDKDLYQNQQKQIEFQEKAQQRQIANVRKLEAAAENPEKLDVNIYQNVISTLYIFGDSIKLMESTPLSERKNIGISLLLDINVKDFTDSTVAEDIPLKIGETVQALINLDVRNLKGIHNHPKHALHILQILPLMAELVEDDIGKKAIVWEIWHSLVG